uniref:(northern house mosquito) hypothetical protein n=1 Tax=Culex pipiens TaxID=7175 RepID=A0A8D8CVF8_CULPI
MAVVAAAEDCWPSCVASSVRTPRLRRHSESTMEVPPVGEIRVRICRIRLFPCSVLTSPAMGSRRTCAARWWPCWTSTSPASWASRSSRRSSRTFPSGRPSSSCTTRTRRVG